MKKYHILSIFIVCIFLFMNIQPIKPLAAATTTAANTNTNEKVFNIEMNADTITTEDLNVFLPKTPQKADVIFCFDLTGSMDEILNTAKSKANSMIQKLKESGVDVNYAIMSTTDYNKSYTSYGYTGTYGSVSNYPYKLDLPLTSDASKISSSLNSLKINSDNDYPVSYTRVLYESYADKNVGWRDGSKRIFVNFGDDLPHDDNVNEGISSTVKSTGGDPGRDEVMGTADDLDLQTVLKEMKNNNIILLSCQTNNAYSEYWTKWAEMTGGKEYNTNSSNLDTLVVNAITENLVTPNISNLKLVPSKEFEPWVKSVSPQSYNGKTDTTVPFNLKLSVPEGTATGKYSYSVNAVDDTGVVYGTYLFNISYKENFPTLTLTPDTTETTSKTVKISAAADSEKYDIKSIKLPDGKTVESSTAEYTAQENGTYTFTVTDSKGHETSENIVINNIKPDVILNVEPNMTRTHLDEHFIVDLTADHINNVGGFDTIIKYDSNKLKLSAIQAMPEIKYISKRLGPGEVRFTLFGLTAANFIQNKESILKLGFDGIAPGNALIDITKGKISDGLSSELNLRDAECGQTIINICNRKLTSVNSDDSEFTLLDATIVARHIGEDPVKLLPAIDADLNLDGVIDEKDVDKAYELMNKNPNYTL